MTAVPRDLPEVITTRAREVTRGADSDFAKAVALQDWFRQDGGFRYSLEQRSGSGMDLLAAFVTDDRVGYCEQFAAAMAAMGRALDIPSRVVVGFLDGTTQPDGRILYTSDDRHAWPEMYFSGVGWVRFEPTPGPARRRDSRVDPPVRGRRAALRQPERRRQPEPGAGARCSGEPTPKPTAAGAVGAVVAAGGSARRRWCWRSCPRSYGGIQRRRRLSARRSGPPRRGCLGRAAGDRARPGAGLARVPLTARAGAPGGRPGATPRTTTSSRWRGCWSGWSGGATAAQVSALDRLAGTPSTPRCAPALWRPSTRGAR